MSYQRNYQRRVRVALVGVGKHAYRNILPLLTYLPVELRAVCDLDEELARSTARQYSGGRYYLSPQEMYRNEELDAVLLCVGQHHHPELAAQAFAAGLHVWMEKPPATRAGQVARLISERGDRVCVVGLKKAFMPATAKARELIDGPDFGPPRSVLGLYPLGTIPLGGEKTLNSEKSPGWLKNGCHPVSFMLAVAGSVETVTVHRGASGASVCLLQFANGCLGNLHLANGAPTSQPVERYVVMGDGVQLEIDNNSRVKLQRGIPFDYENQVDFTAGGLDGGAILWEPQNHLSTLENRAEVTQGVYGELFEFFDCILSGRQPRLGSLEFALEVMKVYEAGVLSEGEPVALSEVALG